MENKRRESNTPQLLNFIDDDDHHLELDLLSSSIPTRSISPSQQNITSINKDMFSSDEDWTNVKSSVKSTTTSTISPGSPPHNLLSVEGINIDSLTASMSPTSYTHRKQLPTPVASASLSVSSLLSPNNSNVMKSGKEFPFFDMPEMSRHDGNFLQCYDSSSVISANIASTTATPLATPAKLIPTIDLNSTPACDFLSVCVTGTDQQTKLYSEDEMHSLLDRQSKFLTAQFDERMKINQQLFEQNTKSRVKHYLRLTPLNQIICHEEILPDRVDKLYNYILSYGLNNPLCIPAIIVDIHTLTIIDGHHRYYTLQRLGIVEVEVLFVDYLDDDIIIESEYKITKQKVIDAGITQKLLKPKETRHLILKNGKYVPILCISTIISFVLRVVLQQM